MEDKHPVFFLGGGYLFLPGWFLLLVAGVTCFSLLKRGSSWSTGNSLNIVASHADVPQQPRRA